MFLYFDITVLSMFSTNCARELITFLKNESGLFRIGTFPISTPGNIHTICFALSFKYSQMFMIFCSTFRNGLYCKISFPPRERIIASYCDFSIAGFSIAGFSTAGFSIAGFNIEKLSIVSPIRPCVLTFPPN